MKDFFSDSLEAMHISKDGQSSPSISPVQQQEDTGLSFSSGGPFYLPTTGQPPCYNYGYYNNQDYHYSDIHPGLMYPDHSADTPLLLFDSSIPSPPSSTRSSSSIQNFNLNNSFFLNASKKYPIYTSALYFKEDTTPQETEKKVTRSSPSCSQDNQRKEGETHTKEQTNKEGGKKTIYHKRHVREKGKKRCSNCFSNNSPSWRRSISKYSKGDLLCNACGLYEKTAKKRRMLITHDDGNTKVVRKRDARDYSCASCGVRNIARWRRMHDTIQCERCARRAPKY